MLLSLRVMHIPSDAKQPVKRAPNVPPMPWAKKTSKESSKYFIIHRPLSHVVYYNSKYEWIIF